MLPGVPISEELLHKVAVRENFSVEINYWQLIDEVSDAEAQYAV